MKQTKHILLTAVMLLCSFAASAQDFEVDGIYYSITSSTDLTVVVTSSPNGYNGAVTIPAIVNYGDVNYSVTSIGEGAFYWCENLTAITIPESVTSIGNAAFFNCSSLTSITIPKSVTSIGNAAFYGTAWYDNQPDGVLYLDEWLLEYKGTMPNNTSINVKEGTKGIADAAFLDCSSLTSVTLPEGVTSIGTSAFANCSSLTAITIPASVTSIGNSAFYSCSSLTSITIPENSQLTSIGEHAFYDCDGLTSITLPKGVTSIESSAFYGCDGLTSITLPEGVTSIGNSAFYSCSSLTSITIPENSQLTSIGEWAFFYCSSLTSITLPESVTSIGGSAFYGTAWYNNKPDGPVYVGKVLYKYKGEMPENTMIEVREGTVSISDDAFEDCYHLTSITIPESVISVGYRAFYGCSILTSITIPESVTSIGDYAFDNCTSLKEVIIEDGSKTLSLGYNYYYYSSGTGQGLFYDCPLETVYLGRNLSYRSGSSYGYSPFYNKTKLATLTIGENVTSIGESAFEYCSSLTSINIPEKSQLTSIGQGAFYCCSSLTSITIPESVTSIGGGAFEGCSGLKHVEINCSNVGAWFSHNAAIKEVVLGEGVTTVENQAFKDCSGLTSITIGKNVIEIGEIASLVFSGCTSLKEVIFEDGSETLTVGCNQYGPSTRYRKSLFIDCPLEKVYLGRNLSYSTDKKAGYSPFYGNETLTSLTIGPEVTEVGEYAFSGCGLDSITCYAIVPPTCYASTFAGVDTSIPVYVPEGSVADYQAAEVWKDFFNFVGADLTGIDNLEPTDNGEQQAVIYDLMGRRVTNPTKGGIYIVNGRKVVVK